MTFKGRKSARQPRHRRNRKGAMMRCLPCHVGLHLDGRHAARLAAPIPTSCTPRGDQRADLIGDSPFGKVGLFGTPPAPTVTGQNLSLRSRQEIGLQGQGHHHLPPSRVARIRSGLTHDGVRQHRIKLPVRDTGAVHPGRPQWQPKPRDPARPMAHRHPDQGLHRSAGLDQSRISVNISHHGPPAIPVVRTKAHKNPALLLFPGSMHSPPVPVS